MQIDGLTPSNGPQGPDRPAGNRKAESKPGGKSFADALGKAKSASGPIRDAEGKPETAAGAPAPGQAPGSSHPATPPAEESMGSHIDTIRFRLQSGYYDSKKVTDALGDKLSDFFDDAA